MNRCHISCCKQRMVRNRFSLAILFVSLFSFSVCFPTDGTAVPKFHPKKKFEPRSSFRQGTYSLSSDCFFLADALVLSLSFISETPKPDLAQHESSKKRKTSKKRSNKITFKNIDNEGYELPLRTVEYRRRKHEWAKRYTSQQGLREAFGSNRNKWWGDLDAKTARRLYKRLLFPTIISELVLELGDEIVRPEELAPLAYEARKAAKMYVRERCKVPSRVGAYLFDGFRQFRKYGRFQPNGASYEQLWIRYYEEYGNSSNNSTGNERGYLFGQDDDDDESGNTIDETDDMTTEDEIVKRTCQKILEKSCATNEAIDRICLKECNINAAIKKEPGTDSLEILEKNDSCNNKSRDKSGETKEWQKKRKRKDRFNDLLLERITMTLERDVRKLLEPPPSSPSSSVAFEIGEYFYSEHNDAQNEHDNIITNTTDNNSSIEKRKLSSRMMTRQEYHSLKLFAKARKNSQKLQLKDDSSNT